ncbi:MAG TPA: pilus assembly PilX N-terminal domain-containing protein [Blastocatellia bacterium]|nr:pilus assembly PilX N-terminal domain-containing protein [Blastocatellia bacterium]
MLSNQADRSKGERGIALIAALMVSAILLALGMAVAMSATSDTVTTKSQRVGEQAFFAADAGVAIARRALSTALQEEIEKIRNGTASYGTNGFTFIGDPPAAGEFPDLQVIPDPTLANWANHPFYANVRNRARQLSQVENRDNRLRELNGTSFTAAFLPLSGTVTLRTNPGDARNAVEEVVLRYSIRVTGTTEAGGRSSVVENGRITTSINLVNLAASDHERNFSFSGFGAFFDHGDTNATSALASGTFSGPVHTNTHFAFRSDWNVQFRNIVSQVDDYIRYDSSNFSQGRRSIPGSDIKGIDISSEGYKRTNYVPLPENDFSQEYAVINATGITDKKADGTPVDPPARIPLDNHGDPVPVFDSEGRVTVEVLAANLRDAANKEPVIQGSGSNKRLADGVYVSSGNGNTITGAGIYVQGNADDVQLYASGSDQYYIIKQGGKTTTIQVSPATNQTTITGGGKTTTYSGVPTDRSDPVRPKPGLSFYVSGSIASLHGGVGGAAGSNVKPALASGTRLTITAQRDIVVTGDIKYADPVVNSDGTAVSNIGAVQNVLGIFTNDGNVELAPNTSYINGPGRSLEINGAIIAFNNSISNDGGGIEGSITYTGTAPGSNDRWKLVGSRVQSKINNIGYSKRDVFFDTRFAGGKFGPPFFPGTKYDLIDVPGEAEIEISLIEDARPTGMTWFRENN